MPCESRGERLWLWSSIALLPGGPVRKAKHKCPSCGSENVRHSGLHGPFDRLLLLFRIRPYRCQECDYRFYARRSLPDL
jgi:hypothetical protein